MLDTVHCVMNAWHTYTTFRKPSLYPLSGKIILKNVMLEWAGWLSRYSDWLRAGRSGDLIPVGNETFRTRPDRPWGPSSLLYNWYRIFPGGKSGRGVTLTPNPLLVPWSWKGRAIPLLPYGPYGLSELQCLYKGALYLLPNVRPNRQE